MAGMRTIGCLAAPGLLLSFALCASASGPSWEPAGWGGGGFFWSCLCDPRGNGILYLGGDVCGAYKSTDRGRHWRLANRGLSNYAVYSLALCPAQPRFVYAMTESGVCRSEDEGESWRALPATAPGALDVTCRRHDTVRGLAVHPKDPLAVWAGTGRGRLYRTTDGGESWTEVRYAGTEAPAGAVASVAVSARDPSRVLVAHRSTGVFASRDDGKTWKRSLAETGAFTVAFSPADGAVAFAGFAGGRVFLSGDGGWTWTPGGGGWPAGAAVREIVPHPGDPRQAAAIGMGDWAGWFGRTTDGGRTWIVVRPKLRIDPAGNPTVPGDASSADLSSPTNLAVDPADPERILISANWRNAWSGDGGRTWEERSRGADISVVEDLWFLGGEVFAVAMDEGLLASSDLGATWRQLFPLRYAAETSGHQWRVRAWNRDGRVRVVSTLSPWDAKTPNRVLVSDDGGKTFAVASRGLPACVPARNTMWGRSYPRAMAQDPVNPDVLYLGMDGDPEPAHDPECAGGFFVSADGGRSWRRPASQPGSRRVFFGLAADPSRPGRIVWGACGEQGGVWLSNDRGETWSHVFAADAWVFNVLVTPAGRILAAGRQLWASDDGGKAWKPLTSFDDACVTVGLEADPADPNRIWISRTTWDSNARGGVFRTLDGGASWENITADLPCVKPLILRWDPGSRNLWAAGPGIFRIRQ